MECWGSNRFGQATPPDGEFASVSAGYRHTCGVRTDGTVECWGSNRFGRATPPDGEFASVSAGDFHTCGVRTDGTVECWGSNGSGRATPPDGEFASVSAGKTHTCGVRTDGTVFCWGWDGYGQATPSKAYFGFTHDGLQPSTVYSYEVRACNETGCSSPGRVAGLTEAVGLVDIPSPPTIQAEKVDVVGTDEARVTWGKVDGATYYEVYQRGDGRAFHLDAVVSAPRTSYYDDRPRSHFFQFIATTYTVRACNKAGCSAHSEESTAR